MCRLLYNIKSCRLDHPLTLFITILRLSLYNFIPFKWIKITVSFLIFCLLHVHFPNCKIVDLTTMKSRTTRLMYSTKVKTKIMEKVTSNKTPNRAKNRCILELCRRWGRRKRRSKQLRWKKEQTERESDKQNKSKIKKCKICWLPQSSPLFNSQYYNELNKMVNYQHF